MISPWRGEAMLCAMSRFGTVLFAVAACVVAVGCRPAASAKDVPASELVLPRSSADYRAVLAEVLLYKHGKIDLDELTSRIVDMKLPPHPRGCSYLLADVPMPPEGMKFEAAEMPADWKNTFGEVAITHLSGKLTLEEYESIHAAAHRSH